MTDFLLASLEASWYHVVAGYLMFLASMTFGYHYLVAVL